jgi:hypothetical protein
MDTTFATLSQHQPSVTLPILMLDGYMLELGVSLMFDLGPLSGRFSLFPALIALTAAVFTTSLCDLVRAWKQAIACIPNNSSVCS